MTYTNNIVTKPVDITSVSNLIGAGTNDLAALCKSSRINKWAKFKPIAAHVLFPDMSTEGNRYIHAKNYNADDTYPTIFGLRITGVSSMIANTGNDHVYNMYEDEDEESQNHYVYVKPTGATVNSNSFTGFPYRLGDFWGYYHKAIPFCKTVNITKADFDDADKFEEHRVGPETNAVSAIFGVEGLHGNVDRKYGMRFSDFDDLSVGKMVLCANIVNANTGETIAEYVNNGIKLYSANQSTELDEDYDDTSVDSDGKSIDSFKNVTVNFSKADYWGSKSEYVVWVYLTFDWVRYSGGQWISARKMIIPYDVNHYFKKKIKFIMINRVLQAMEFQTGQTSTAIVWGHYNTPISNYNLVMSPRVHFSISKTPQAINIDRNFGGTGYWVRTKYYDTSTGTTITREGTLFSETGAGIPQEGIAVPADPQGSGTVDFYYQFTDIFGSGDNPSFFVSGHYYTVDLYLAHKVGDDVVDEKVGSMFIIKK